MADKAGEGSHWSIVALLWGTLMVVGVIRVSLGVVAPTLMSLYQISPKTMGYVLSGWNWSYTACQLVMGPVVDRFGPWITLGVGGGIWGLATVALPVATGAISLFLMRAAFGLGHSMMIPGQASAVSRWFRPDQRSTTLGFTFSGSMVGLAAGSTIAAFLLDSFGWQSVFYCIGGASLALTLLWLTLYPEKKIARQRRAGGTETKGKERIPLLALLRYRSAWGIALGQMGYLYGYNFFVNWLPGYLILERKMSVLRTGVVASLPFWMGMVGTLGGGWLADYLMRRGLGPTGSRKGVIGVGMTLATITVVIAAFTPQTWLAVTLLTLCMGSLRATTGAANSIPIDLAPHNAVGSLTSIQNFGGNIGGLLAPVVTGYILQATGSFVWALVAAGAMSLFGAVCYVFMVGRVEPLQISS